MSFPVLASPGWDKADVYYRDRALPCRNTIYICLVSNAEICPVSAADICPVSTADICPVSTEDISILSQPVLARTGKLINVRQWTFQCKVSRREKLFLGSSLLHSFDDSLWFWTYLFATCCYRMHAKITKHMLQRETFNIKRTHQKNAAESFQETASLFVPSYIEKFISEREWAFRSLLVQVETG